MKRFYFSKLLIFVALLSGWSLSSIAQTTTFTFNGTTNSDGSGIGGSPQTYVVPAGVTSVAVDMYGGAGGWPCCSWTSGGTVALGGRVQCTLAVTPGTTLYVYVAGAGGNSIGNDGTQKPGGWPNGGIGGAVGSAYCGSGGGESDIRLSTTLPYGAGNQLVVAGGGGGGGDFGPLGGIGGGLTGGTGGGGACGGGQTGPSCTSGSTLGTQGQGGSCTCYSQGGGGGGWWGGNCGSSDNGGGGGSSYTSPTLCTSVIHTQGYSSANANGSVTITVLCSTPVSGTISGPSSVCLGSVTPYATTATSGGTWYSSNTSVATVDTSGVVRTVSAGTSTISYSLVRSCGIGTGTPKTITVNPLPLAITGSANSCLGLTTALSDATAAGKWSSGNTSVASINASTGIVTGLALGTSILTYQITATGCLATIQETVNPLPNIYTVSIAGSGTMCKGGIGFHILLSNSDVGVSYQLRVGGVPIPGVVVAGLGGPIDFGLDTIGGLPYTVLATNTSTGCSILMAGNPMITINPLPTQYPLTIAGTASASYCLGTTGLDIQLGNSKAGINYQLFLGAVPVGTPMAGSTGHAVDFGIKTDSGSYTVVGTDTTSALKCAGNMLNSVKEIINPLPNIYSVSGGGGYCAGNPAGQSITLSKSDAGVTYELVNGGTHTGITQGGTGSALTFSAVTIAGTYTISAVNGNGCTVNMAGSVVISINPLPNVYPMSPSAQYCVGTSGADVSLTVSNPGIRYQLYNGSGLITGAVSIGTGGVIDYGLQPAGSYYIVGTNTTTHCTSNMPGTTITISIPPTTYLVTGGGPFCAGGTGDTIGLNGSDATATYQLYLNNVAVAGGLITGTGSPFNYGLKTDSGTYTIVATNTATPNCTSTMNGNAVITVNPLPTAYILTATGSGAYCAGSTAPTLTLSGSDGGIQYQLNLDGSPIGPTYNGVTGSPIVFTGTYPLAGTYTVSAINLSTNCTGNMGNSVKVSINPLPTPSAVTGGGDYCTGGTGKNITLSFSTTGVNYQLYRNSVAVPGAILAGNGGGLDFGLDTAQGTYTIVATNPTTNCSSNMTGSQVIATTPLPTPYLLTGGGGYCAGGLGSDVILKASNSGIKYQLYDDGITVGGTVPGTGRAIDFGLQPIAGSYTVIATNVTTTCTNNMTDSVSITVNLLPNIYTVSGGGNYCPGSAGKDVSLIPASDNGVNYQLFLDGAPSGHIIAGTGSAIDFGTKTATGTYTVIAVNASAGCTSDMSGSAIVNMSSLPTVYTVTGGGAYCAGDTGRHIEISSSDVGNIYQLYKGGVLAGDSATGTGASLDFGLLTAGGAYTVQAINTSTTCSVNMSSGVTITVNSAPHAYTVMGGGHYCSGGTGVDISLDSSDLGITYQLYNGATPIGFVAPGMKSMIDFGLQAAAATYTVMGTNPATGCSGNMKSSATVTIDPWVKPLVAVSSDAGATECAGTSTTFVAVPVNGGLIPVYQWFVNGTPVTGIDSSYNYIPNNLDVISVTMTSNDPCPAPATASGSMRMNVNPMGTPAVSVTADPGLSVCQGTNVNYTAHPSFGGVAPVYYWMQGGSVVDSGVTFSYVPNNSDVVSLMMIGNYACVTGSDSANTTATMTVKATAPPVFSLVSTKPSANLSLGSVDTIKAVVTSSGTYSYQWILNANPLTSETSSTLVRNDFFNKDSVTCIVTNTDDCGTKSVAEHIVLTVRNTTGVGTVTVSGMDVRVIPNPNKGAFVIKGTLGSMDDQEVSLEVTNMLGQSVYKNTAMTHNGNINEQVQLNSSLANGMYILNVRSGSESNVFHFVIEQ